MDFYTHQEVLEILNRPEMKFKNKYTDFLKNLRYISRLYSKPNESRFVRFRIFLYNNDQIENWKLNILSGRRTEYNPYTKSKNSITKLKYCLFYTVDTKNDYSSQVNGLLNMLNNIPNNHDIKLENFREDFPEFFI